MACESGQFGNAPEKQAVEFIEHFSNEFAGLSSGVVSGQVRLFFIIWFSWISAVNDTPIETRCHGGMWAVAARMRF